MKHNDFSSCEGAQLLVPVYQPVAINRFMMMALRVFLISFVVPMICSYAVGGQHFDCNSLSQQSTEEWIPIHSSCIDFVSSRFTTIDRNEPEFDDIVKLCACKLIKKNLKNSDLADKESLWGSLEEELFSESGNESKQPIDHLNEDELEDYFENLLENQEELEEESEEELQASGFNDPVREEQLVDSIQMGISKSLAEFLSKPIKRLDSKDFSSVEKESLILPATDRYPESEFKFKTYAPVAFYNLRKIYGIESIDLFHSIRFQNSRLIRFGNPGASGSGFFRTQDDLYFIKTQQSNEAELFIDILKSYYKNFETNPRSLLPKFLGQFAYYGPHLRKIHLLVMNNLLPSSVTMNYKYDLKGSTYNRKASAKERTKSSPTFKDLDFRDQNAKGFTLEPEIYDALMATIKKDVKFLKTFHSMDYSLLLGVHKVESESDLALAERTTVGSLDKTNQFGPIEAIDGNGQKVLLYMGIIDILQDYRLSKRLESHWKTLVQAENISVKHPSFYAQRFYDFISKMVFKRGQ